MRRFVGWILFLVASWMLVSPQAVLGLRELKWMARYAFPGEILLSIPVLTLAYYLLNFRLNQKTERLRH
jgi:hypothetical protein